VKIGDRPAAVIGDEIRDGPLFRIRDGKGRKVGRSESQKTCLMRGAMAFRIRKRPPLSEDEKGMSLIDRRSIRVFF
jgi:hypothetical protein